MTTALRFLTVAVVAFVVGHIGGLASASAEGGDFGAIGGNLSISTGDTRYVNVAGDTMTGALQCNAGAYVVGTLSVDGGVGVTGAVTVSGATNANGGIVAQAGNLTVASPDGGVLVTGRVAVTGAVTVSGAVTSNGLYVDGGITARPLLSGPEVFLHASPADMNDAKYFCDFNNADTTNGEFAGSVICYAYQASGTQHAWRFSGVLDDSTDVVASSGILFQALECSDGQGSTCGVLESAVVARFWNYTTEVVTIGPIGTLDLVGNGTLVATGAANGGAVYVNDKFATVCAAYAATDCDSAGEQGRLLCHISGGAKTFCACEETSAGVYAFGAITASGVCP